MSTFRCGSLCLPKTCCMMLQYSFLQHRCACIVTHRTNWQDITVLPCFRRHNMRSRLQQSQELQFDMNSKFSLLQLSAGNWRCQPLDLKYTPHHSSWNTMYGIFFIQSLADLRLKLSILLIFPALRLASSSAWRTGMANHTAEHLCVARKNSHHSNLV